MMYSNLKFEKTVLFSLSGEPDNGIAVMASAWTWKELYVILQPSLWNELRFTWNDFDVTTKTSSDGMLITFTKFPIARTYKLEEFWCALTEINQYPV